MSEPPVPDRREHSRIPAELHGRIGFAPARFLDLSARGTRLETKEWLAIGQRCTLRLGDPPFQLPARVVHCRLARLDQTADGARAVYEAGLVFDVLSSQQVDHLLASLAAA
jgi:hypothetical protein